MPEDQQNQQLITKIFLTVGSEMTFLKKCSQIIFTARVAQGVWVLGMAHSSSLTALSSGAALPGAFGVYLIPCLIHLSVLSACASLPANTPEFPCNNNLDLGGLHLDSILESTEAARIAGSRSS